MSAPAYSPSVICHGPMIPLSGILGVKDRSEPTVVGGGQNMAAEFEVIMGKIDAELAKHGLTRLNVCSAQIKVVESGEFEDNEDPYEARWQAFNNMWAEAFKGNPVLPTRDYCEVVRLSRKASLETTLWASTTVSPAPETPPKREAVPCTGTPRMGRVCSS